MYFILTTLRKLKRRKLFFKMGPVTPSSQDQAGCNSCCCCCRCCSERLLSDSTCSVNQMGTSSSSSSSVQHHLPRCEIGKHIHQHRAGECHFSLTLLSQAFCSSSLLIFHHCLPASSCSALAPSVMNKSQEPTHLAV